MSSTAEQCHQRQKRGDAGNGRALRGGVRRRRRCVAEDASRPRLRESASEPNDMSHFRPPLVEGIADGASIGARTLIATRQGFTDVDKEWWP
jgi:hypothetical protein